MSLVDFISEKLATVELKDEEISEYIAGIVSEEFLEESEKREALTEFLCESTSKPTDDLIDSFLNEWYKEQEKEKEAAEVAKAEAAAKAKEREKNSLAAGIPNSSGDDTKEPLTMSRRMAPKQMTKEERARRERLMREYGYDLEDVVEGENGETEIIYKDRSKKASAEDPLLMSNRNAEVIKEQEKNRRDKMKQQSEMEKERNKQQQEKQKLDKEKEKRRTMKKEKRRIEDPLVLVAIQVFGINEDRGLTNTELVDFKGQSAIDRMDGGDDMIATSATPSPPGTPISRHSQSNTPVQDADDIIPTAIVIKNIPFSVKKDVLITIMNSMDLPQPHAFNYHFDNGIFRGLAFANYRNREETDFVIQTLNGLDLGGRKLRVEYKKMLPGQEREIYLSDDVRDSLSPSSSSRLSSKKEGMNEKRDSRNSPRLKSDSEQDPSPEDGPLDLNHPDTLLFYDQLFQFRSDPSRDIFIYPKTTSSKQRRIIHYLADRLGLYHYSDGDGSERQLHIVKKPANAAQLRGDGVGRRSPQRGTRNRLRQSQSQDRVRDSENGSPPRRENFRRSFVSSSPLSDSSGTNTPNVMYPIRQPIGPVPEKNFASRSANMTRKMSQLNLDAPAFEPAGLSQ